MMTKPVISVRDVEREYITQTGFLKRTVQVKKAVQGISFSVQEGEIFGLLGPNGAGKTTMIKMLTTMLIPTSGEISVLGLDAVNEYKKLRPQINFILGGERNLYWRLSAYDNLAYFSDLYKIPRNIQKNRIWELLELVGLQDVAHQKVETYSKGMKQKLQIARGLVNKPRVLFLDEPTIGLDPVSARHLRCLLRDLNAGGTTIVITTHYMYEADELCDRIAFVNGGRLIKLDTPDNLKKLTDSSSVLECKLAGLWDEKVETLRHLPGVILMNHEQQEQRLLIRLHTKDPKLLIPYVYQVLEGKMITDLTISSPTLEDAYIRLVGDQVS